MPLKRGSSPATISKNIQEFHHGQTYRRTLNKFGPKVAQRQAIAVAEIMARKSRSGRR